MINRQIGRYPISDKLVYTEYTHTINLRTILCHGELHVCQEMSRSAMRAKLRSYDSAEGVSTVRPRITVCIVPNHPMVSHGAKNKRILSNQVDQTRKKAECKLTLFSAKRYLLASDSLQIVFRCNFCMK